MTTKPIYNINGPVTTTDELKYNDESLTDLLLNISNRLTKLEAYHT